MAGFAGSMAELPTGTVTFLFTDVERSTDLLRQLRERYSEVLAEHQRLLRAAFEEAGGHEMNTQGDSFFVAFSRARDAVNAALAGQRALQAHPWPEGVELHVRMGIHTGEAVLAENEYHGLAVHRAARICAAGHGGQILLSQTSHTLLEDEEHELPELALHDLGRQRLKKTSIGRFGSFSSARPTCRSSFPRCGRSTRLRLLRLRPRTQMIGDSAS